MAGRIPTGLSRREARSFGLVIGAVFLALGGVSWWRGRALPSLAFGALGAALVLLGLVLPAALVPVRRAWMWIGAMISKVTTPIFLGVVYFGVLTPIGLVRRLLGNNPLKPRERDGSFWVVRDGHGKDPKDMERQF